MMLVCQNWRRTLCNLPSVWAVLDLTAPNRTLHSRALHAYFRRSKGLCSELRICEERSPQTEEVVRYAAEYLQRLQFFEIQKLRGCARVIKHVAKMLTLRKLVCTFHGERGSTGFEDMAWLIDSLPKLEFAKIDLSILARDHKLFNLRAKYPNLKHLVLTTNQAELNVMDTASKAPNLRTLHLSGWTFVPYDSPADFSHFHRLVDLDISSCGFRQCPALPESLEVLEMEQNIFNSRIYNWGHLPRLKSLHMFMNMDDEVVIPSLEPQIIEKIHIRNFFTTQGGLGRPQQELRQFFSRTSVFTALRELDLSQHSWFSDDDVDEVAPKTPNLKALSITSTHITGVSVRKILTSCAQLEHLNINGCHGVSPDAVDWARSCGVNVSFLFPYASYNGKKVPHW